MFKYDSVKMIVITIMRRTLRMRSNICGFLAGCVMLFDQKKIV